MAQGREGTAGAAAAPPDSGHTDARIAELTSAPDPFAAAFGVTEPGAEGAGTEGQQPAGQPATPPETPPSGQPEGEQQAANPDPSPREQGTPDFDTASPDEVRAWLRKHPNASKALGLEVRQHVQRREAELAQERQGREQAEAQAAQAREYAEKVQGYQDAYYDEDHPEHWDAVRFFAQQGIQPLAVQRLIAQPAVQQQIGAIVQQQTAAAREAATAEATQQAILAAAEHPAFKGVKPEVLEAAWQESDGVADFYAKALQKSGWLSPSAAAEYRTAAQAEARTRVYGEMPPAEGSIVHRDANPRTTRPIPAQAKDIDPTDWFVSGFTPAATA